MRTHRITLFSSPVLPVIFASLFLLPVSTFAAGPDLSVAKSCAVNGPQAVLCTVTVTNIGNVASVAP